VRHPSPSSYRVVSAPVAGMPPVEVPVAVVRPVVVLSVGRVAAGAAPDIAAPLGSAGV